MDDLGCALKEGFNVESVEPPSVHELQRRIRVRRLKRRVLAGKLAAGCAGLGLILITALYIAWPSSVSVRVAGTPSAKAGITGQILLAGPIAFGIPGTVWAFEENTRGKVVATAESDSRGDFILTVPAPGVYIIGGDSPKFDGGSPMPDHPVPACVSSQISVSPEVTTTVRVLCQAQ